MNKKLVFWTALITLVFSLFINVLFGRWIATKLSLVPFISRWRIIQPQSPIIIERREEIRVSDSGDIIQAVSSAKSRISSVFRTGGGRAVLAGNAVNITSDGRFVTSSQTFSVADSGHSVMLSDGRTAAITEFKADAATGLVFFRAQIDGVPVANFGESERLGPGERVFFLGNSGRAHIPRFKASFVTLAQNDTASQNFDADLPTRSFGVQAVEGIDAGEAIISLNSDVVGLWNGSRIISSDIIRNRMALYLSGAATLTSPRYGFTYQAVLETESRLLSVPAGARVVQVLSGGPAAKAGLLPEDIIIRVNGGEIKEDELLEEFLQRTRSGDTVTLTVVRKTQTLEVKIAVQ